MGVEVTEGLQDRNTNIIAGTTVENKGKLILLKVTLDIVEDVFFSSPERAAARASTMNLYIKSSYCRLRKLPFATGKPSLENLIKACWNNGLSWAKLCQPTAGVTSIYPQTKVNDH